ncbi:aromatic ring-hydroxylating dioxygenase subunit alpha [Parasphingorhabdus sp.]|uniref:aromatic ring-hydroxylating oxygenase subunit alpha n=1 Tax=Parasphingorhabdus sp. TaxID=2709688 RepID=UPI0032632362
MATTAEQYDLKRPMADKSKRPEPVFKNTTITADRYFSRDFMDQEWETIWTKTWQIACLSREIQKPGDFVTTELGRESILCTMANDGKVRAFYNVCQHRGMELMPDRCGNAKRLTCPYHGWAYDMEGKLKFVPDEADFAQGSPCGKLNLVEIPCESWAGFVWYNMDENCAPLKEFLGPIADQIDSYPMEEMIRTHWVTIEGDFNWKLVQDNFSESYHVPFVHPETKFVMEYSYKNSQFDHYPEGHCRMLMPGSIPTSTLKGGENETLEMMKEELEFWELDPDQYRSGKTSNMRKDLQKQKRLLGEEKGFDFSSYHDEQLTDHWHYTIFPNLSFSLKPDGNIWLRARPHESDPEKCYFDMWYMTLFPKGVTEYYSQTMKTLTSIDNPAVHCQGKADEVSAGPAIDQDIAVWNKQQKGLHSRGYGRDYLAGQESRMRYFHETLEQWMKR